MAAPSRRSHGLEKNIFERIPAVTEAAQLQIALGRQAEDVARIEARRQDYIQAARTGGRTLASPGRQRLGETGVIAGGFDLHEALVGAPLLFEIRAVHDPAVLE